MTRHRLIAWRVKLEGVKKMDSPITGGMRWKEIIPRDRYFSRDGSSP